ncbi:hypothetical protein MMC29_003070 [Sticta canariensis]|nr:hypothetical protein [Sticta canariensis]
MVKFGPPSPKVNTLDVFEQRTYGDTFTETWRIIQFFLEDMKPVNTADLELGDRKCEICRQDFTLDFHRAVRLPCNHTFGEPCIKSWLSPYAPWTPSAGAAGGTPVGANTCPTCRREFFPEQSAVDSLPEIEARNKLWDMAYAHVGIALSEREFRAREDLLRYLDSYFARELDEYYPSNSERRNCPTWSNQRLFLFSNMLKQERLTPVQEHLRQGLEVFASQSFPVGMTWRRNDQFPLFFQLEDDSETVRDGESHENHEETEIEEEKDGESHESHEEAEVEEESKELAEGDTEEMRFFRTLFRKANLLPTWRAPIDQIMNDVTSEDEFMANEDQSGAKEEVSQDGTVANEEAINADGVELENHSATNAGESICYPYPINKQPARASLNVSRD